MLSVTPNSVRSSKSPVLTTSTCTTRTALSSRSSSPGSTICWWSRRVWRRSVSRAPSTSWCWCSTTIAEKRRRWSRNSSPYSSCVGTLYDLHAYCYFPRIQFCAYSGAQPIYWITDCGAVKYLGGCNVLWMLKNWNPRWIRFCNYCDVYIDEVVIIAVWSQVF